MLVLISKYLKKNRINLSLALKEYVKLNGIETEAEILGYTKYNISHPLNPEYDYSAYNTVLRFTDENGIEHITIDPVNNNTYIPYNVGDIVTIKYVDNESINDDKLKNEMSKSYGYNYQKRNDFIEDTLKKSENTKYRNIFTNYSQEYYKGYYSKLNENIILTDEKRYIFFYI